MAESVKQWVGADYVAPEILKDLDNLCAPSVAEASAPGALFDARVWTLLAKDTGPFERTGRKYRG